jgi:creatinine amidohydrolase
MDNHSKYWADWHTTDFERCAMENHLVVLPLGATEQHGPHLPVSVDCLIVQEIIKVAVQKLEKDTPFLILPTQKIGLSTEHRDFKGTLTYSPELVMNIWMALADSLARAGVKKLLLFNAHGGHQSLMEVVAREIRAKHNMMVYSSSWYQLPLKEEVLASFDAHEHRFGIHGGAIETSIILATHPELVREDAFQNFTSSSEERAQKYPILGNSKSAKLAWMMQDYNPSGVVGDLSQASAAKGEALLEDAGGALSRLILEILSLPLSTIRC